MMYAVLYRSLFAFVTAFAVAMLLSVPARRVLLSLYRDRSEPVLPKMGGIVIFAAILIASLIWGRDSYRSLLIALLITGLFGVLGFADDFIGVLRKTEHGLLPWQRLAAFTVLSLASGVVLFAIGSDSVWTDRLPLGVFIVPAAAILIFGTVRAVEHTDVPQGLGASVSGIGFGGMTLLLCMAVLCAPVQAEADSLLNQSALAVFAASAAGGCLGFLMLGAFPARIELGSTGAYTLGGAFAATALLSETPLLLPLFGIVFVLFGASALIGRIGGRIGAPTPSFVKSLTETPVRLLTLCRILTVVCSALALIVYWFFK